MWRIYTVRRKWKILIDKNWLEQYMNIKDQIGGPFQNKTLFEENEQTWAVEQENEPKQNQQEQKTELAMIAWYQGIIQSKDIQLEEKNSTILEQQKQIRYWSNWFFIAFVLFVCSVLFLLYSIL